MSIDAKCDNTDLKMTSKSKYQISIFLSVRNAFDKNDYNEIYRTNADIRHIMHLRVFILLNESIHQVIEIDAQTTCRNRNRPKKCQKFIRFISKN